MSRSFVKGRTDLRRAVDDIGVEGGVDLRAVHMEVKGGRKILLRRAGALLRGFNGCWEWNDAIFTQVLFAKVILQETRITLRLLRVLADRGAGYFMALG